MEGGKKEENNARRTKGILEGNLRYFRMTGRFTGACEREKGHF